MTTRYTPLAGPRRWSWGSRQPQHEQRPPPPLEPFDGLPEDDDSFDENTIIKLERSLHRLGWLRSLSGPTPARSLAVQPLLRNIQWLPARFFHSIAPTPTRRAVAFSLVSLLWCCAFAITLWIGRRPTVDSEGRDVVNLDCVDSFWGRNNKCGPDGVNCEPFANMSFAFRCPASCAGVKVLNPRAVGPLELNYQPLVVGTDVYRGDSFTCASALHAGVINDKDGGCGRVTLIGQQSNFVSSVRNGIASVPFDSYFPLSFTVTRDEGTTCWPQSRQVLLFISLLFTGILALCTTSPSVFFFPVFITGFLHVAFVSDPPDASFHNISVLPDHISLFAERLLPALFCAVVLFRTCIRRTLFGLDAPIEKMLLWLGGFWFGALSNATFGWLPIQRLTPHDLEQQPGAKLSLAVIVIVLIAIAAQQCHSFWLEGRLVRYLGLYVIFLVGILVCLTIPGVQLRIHHYIIGLLLLPGTSLQTRPSLLYQGLLVGLFINGVARWGFDSILQTADALRMDGAFGSPLPNISATPLIQPGLEPNMSLSIAWDLPSAFANVNGISVLVNDVERLRRFFPLGEDDSATRLFTWTRPPDFNSFAEYFRFAFLRDGATLDYTKPSTWFANGTWGGA